MTLNEFKDRLFDLLNETEELPIQDIVVEDKKDQIKVSLTDGSQFLIKCESYGKWFLFNA